VLLQSETSRANARDIFQPLICHSFNEMPAPMAFHPQLIADFLTVEALGLKMLGELAAATAVHSD